MRLRAFVVLVPALLVSFLCAGVVVAQNVVQGKTMSVSAAKKIWGAEVFDAGKFRSGDMKLRSQMAASIVESKALAGKSIRELRELLGPSDGYYSSNYQPAYLIEDGSRDNKDTWQIVFLIDKERKVLRSVIHKNCCD